MINHSWKRRFGHLPSPDSPEFHGARMLDIQQVATLAGVARNTIVSNYINRAVRPLRPDAYDEAEGKNNIFFDYEKVCRYLEEKKSAHKIAVKQFCRKSARRTEVSKDGVVA